MQRIINLLKEVYPGCEVNVCGIAEKVVSGWEYVPTEIEVYDPSQNNETLWSCTFVDKYPIFYDEEGILCCGPETSDEKWEKIQKDNFFLFNEF